MDPKRAKDVEPVQPHSFRPAKRTLTSIHPGDLPSSFTLLKMDAAFYRAGFCLGAGVI